MTTNETTAPLMNSFSELDATRELTNQRQIHSELIEYRVRPLRPSERAVVEGQVRDARNAIRRAVLTIRRERATR